MYVAGQQRFADELIRPFVTVTLVVVTAIQFPSGSPGTITVFVLVAALALATLFPWGRIPQWGQVALMTVYTVLAAILVPLTSLTFASIFAFLASGTAGGKLASRRAAVAVAVLEAVTCATTVAIVDTVAPRAGEWPWWVGLTVGLPVYIGMSRRDQREALSNARRAAESEAREAALVERGRIARELHDVLGHSLTGIAMQLDLADALHGKGRNTEAYEAVHRARGMAVGSITKMREAVHELRDDSLPLTETLQLLSESEAVPLVIVGTRRHVDSDIAHAFVRAAQEALTNAAKYAPGADRAMTLTYTSDSLTLLVSNEPSTRPRSPGLEGGMGLIGIRERVAALGGSMHAGPAESGGWSVELHVPCPILT